MRSCVSPFNILHILQYILLCPSANFQRKIQSYSNDTNDRHHLQRTTPKTQPKSSTPYPPRQRHHNSALGVLIPQQPLEPMPKPHQHLQRHSRLCRRLPHLPQPLPQIPRDIRPPHHETIEYLAGSLFYFRTRCGRSLVKGRRVRLREGCSSGVHEDTGFAAEHPGSPGGA